MASSEAMVSVMARRVMAVASTEERESHIDRRMPPRAVFMSVAIQPAELSSWSWRRKRAAAIKRAISAGRSAAGVSDS